MYRSPNQFKVDFQNFCNNFDLILDAASATNPFLFVAVVDFNAKSTNWYTGDATTIEVSKTQAITSQFQLEQIINELTHI